MEGVKERLTQSYIKVIPTTLKKSDMMKLNVSSKHLDVYTAF